MRDGVQREPASVPKGYSRDVKTSSCSPFSRHGDMGKPCVWVAHYDRGDRFVITKLDDDTDVVRGKSM